jgi:hypothetical protein
MGLRVRVGPRPAGGGAGLVEAGCDGLAEDVRGHSRRGSLVATQMRAAGAGLERAVKLELEACGCVSSPSGACHDRCVGCDY